MRLLNSFLPVFACGALLISSCSTHKNTFINRNFHNLNARYNGYYWADVNLGEAADKIERAHVDDYGKILPVFKYADDKTAKANFPQLDKAIQKTSLVIQRHSMLIKGTEYCKWIDENYLVMGKALFYKRDYYGALEKFQYIVKQFKNSPIRYHAMLWMIRTYNAQNSVINTQTVIALIDNDKNFPKQLHGEFAAVQAEYYIKTENYSKAIQFLVKAVTHTKKKKQRARYVYILAQLYEEKGDLKKASEYYAQVTALGPTYDMLFNARINRAKTFQASGSNDTKEIKRVLTKMLKDEKNKEFLDQIYYALAEIAFKEKNDSLAVKYLKFSAALSAGNTRQRGQSYLRLADIYFAKPDYHTSQAYYDSAVAFLPKDYRNYELIMNKKNSLTNLVKNIRTIMNEDSLQKVVKMDSVQRNKIIEEIIARVIEEEKKKEEEKQKQQSGTGNTGSFYNQQQSGFGSTTTTSGAWYFYNPAAMSLGLSDFYKKWGNRTLEDNWRRELKEKISAFNEDEPEQAQGGNGNKNETKDAKKTKEYYLKNLPFTADQQARSHEKILEAYYALGSIYKEQLQDYPRSSESFEELLKRYPVNKYLLNSYYQLYRLNLLLKNNTRAEYYKNKILKEHPQTEYAKIILNPEYNKEILAARSEVEKFYTETYALYESGNYSEVIARADRADSLYSKSPMAPKFAFLRALSIGKTGQAQEYENALHKIIISYPKDEVKAKAQELLDYLTRAKNAQSNNGNSQDSLAQKIPYAYKKDAQHFCMIIADIKKIDVSDLKNKISNFNGKYFSLETFTMQTLIYEAEKELIVVKSFASADKGMNYYTTLKDNKEVFEKVSSTDYSVSVISSDNYPLLYQRKNTTDYLKFFSENYINKK